MDTKQDRDASGGENCFIDREAPTKNRRKVQKRILKLIQENKPKKRTTAAHWRPETRAECQLVERPCVYVGCRHNLYLDVTKKGDIIMNFPDQEPGDVKESCSLDIADRGENNLEEVGAFMHLSSERARQMEEKLTRRLRDNRKLKGMRE